MRALLTITLATLACGGGSPTGSSSSSEYLRATRPGQPGREYSFFMKSYANQQLRIVGQSKATTYYGAYQLDITADLTRGADTYDYLEGLYQLRMIENPSKWGGTGWEGWYASSGTLVVEQLTPYLRGSFSAQGYSGSFSIRP